MILTENTIFISRRANALTIATQEISGHSPPFKAHAMQTKFHHRILKFFKGKRVKFCLLELLFNPEKLQNLKMDNVRPNHSLEKA